MALMLGGCSVSEVMTDWVSDDAAGPEPINYRFLIAVGLDSIVGTDKINERLLDISSPRRVDGVKGATWVVCLRTLSYPARSPLAYYAVSIQRERIVASHLAYLIDRCELQNYASFEWSRDLTNPVAR